MAHHIHVHIHRTPVRTRDAAKPDADRDALVTALMSAIAAREGKTKDADFKEEDHPRDHGKFTSGGGSGPSGPKPTSATAKGSKAAVHELLSSGHRFSVDELMKATGCSNKSTLMTALADLKNPKYAGKLGALKIEKHADGGYHVVRDDGKKELPIHPDLQAVTRPGAPIPGSGQKPTKAEEEDMATRAGEPRVGAAPKGAAPKGAVNATLGQAPDKPRSQPSKLPIHPELAAVTDPGGTVPGSGKTPTKAEESRMAARAGVPSGSTAPAAKTSPPLYHGGTFSGGKVDGVLYMTPQKSAAESYASATNQRAKVTGSSATSAVKQFKLPEGAKIGTAADVERVAKGLGFNVGPSMSRGQLSAPYLLDKNWIGEQDLKKVTDALHAEGFHGASFQDYDEDRRPHDATAYWGKEDVVPHKEESTTPQLSGTALLLARQQAAREAGKRGVAPSEIKKNN